MASHAPKRPRSPGLIPNPLIKKRNLQWTITGSSSTALVATKAVAADDVDDHSNAASSPPPPPPPTAAVESGAALVADHLAYFSARLSARLLVASPLLSVPSYTDLYRFNAGSPLGAHFVVHQHDHPVAGTHYDLRLQINETSSVSWAVMYGLPGDPNSKRLNRNATETRVHSLWNHLIETASPETGSLLIWDTGTYSILPRRSKHAPRQDPSSPPISPVPSPTHSPPTQQALLKTAFHNRKIRLRLHGSKLPDPYVLNLRLTKAEDASGRSASLRRSRKPRRRPRAEPAPPETSSSDSGDGEENGDDKHLVVASGQEADPSANISALDRELRELEDDEIRRLNAYPGATNSIGSIYQRRWYLSLERPSCGLKATRRCDKLLWEMADEQGSTTKSSHDHAAGERQGRRDASRLSFPFYVRGPEHEISVVTGRRGQDVLRDEQVTSFVRRQGWEPVLH